MSDHTVSISALWSDHTVSISALCQITQSTYQHYVRSHSQHISNMSDHSQHISTMSYHTVNISALCQITVNISALCQIAQSAYQHYGRSHSQHISTVRSQSTYQHYVISHSQHISTMSDQSAYQHYGQITQSAYQHYVRSHSQHINTMSDIYTVSLYKESISFNKHPYIFIIIFEMTRWESIFQFKTVLIYSCGRASII